MKTSKLGTFVGHSTLFEPRLTFGYLDAIFKNRALARDVLKISLIFFVKLSLIYVLKMMFLRCCFSIAQVCRFHADHFQDVDDVLKKSLPCGTS